MGVYKSVVIGPYLQVLGKKEITIIKVRRFCQNHSIKNTDDKFCSICGGLIESEEIPQVKVLTPSKVYYSKEEFEDRLYSPEYLSSIFLPNKYPPGRLNLDSDDSSAIELSNMDELRQNQLDWFYGSYNDIISFMKDEFGVDNVYVKWGLVTYWS